MRVSYEKYVARINYENDFGTALLLTKRFLLTANHVVENANALGYWISVELDTLKEKPFNVQARVIDFSEELDVALIELESELDVEISLVVSAKRIRPKSVWETFGYPKGKKSAGARLDGIIARTKIDVQMNGYDLDLEYNQSNEYIDGLSGAPIFVNDSLVGIITKKLDGTLGGISILACDEFLERNDIGREKENEVVASSSSKSKYTLAKIIQDKVLLTDCGYIFLKGNPGVGKTTFIQSFNFDTNDIAILGKYVIRVSEEENLIGVRSSQDYLLRWLEDKIHFDLYENIPAKTDRSFHEWVVEIIKLLGEVSKKYSTLNKKCLLIIDGIEELIQFDNVLEFFQIFPVKLPENIVILIAGQNENLLPDDIEEKVQGNIIEVPPLDRIEVESIVNQELPSVSFGIMNQIYQKSEGNPLYLKYIISYIQNNLIEDFESIERWLSNAPNIEGDIKYYYERVWQQIKSDEQKIELLSYVARLREAVTEEIFYQIVPDTLRVKLKEYLTELRHLILNDEKVFSYHVSLGEFLKQRTNLSETDIHKKISLYCINNRVCMYSVRNILHHLLRSGLDVVTIGKEYCTQEWADNCTISFVEPSLILNDLKEVLKRALVQGNIPVVVSLMLLSQRVKFRYNDILAYNAFEITNYLAEINKPNKSIKHAFRHSFSLLTLDELIYLQYKFIIKDSYDEAEYISEFIRNRFICEYETGSVAFTDIYNYFISSSLGCCLISSTPNKDSSRLINTLHRLLSNSSHSDDDSPNRLILCKILGHNIALLLLHRNQYVSVEEYKNKGAQFDSTICLVLLNAANYLNHYSAISGVSKNDSELLKDVEYVLKEYGIEEQDNEFAVSLLDDLCIDSDLLNSLLANVECQLTGNIRQDNGVDLNINWYSQLLKSSKYEGFQNSGELNTSIHEFSVSAWEKTIEELVVFIGRISGQAWYLHTKGDSLDSKAKVLLDTVLPVLEFSLLERSSFDRSYAIVEDVVPLIYREIIDFLVLYSEKELGRFIDFIIDEPANQLGIYSEGYVTVLTVLVGRLESKSNYDSYVFKLLRKLEKHVLAGVQNRWDRCKHLLFISTHYAKINSSRSCECFQSFLDSSMGPSWYKEDQLELIDTALELLEPYNVDWSAKILAATLQFAAGEMTFQRYIRMQKEEFIASLCRCKKVDKAIAYFHDQTIPTSHKIIISRAEGESIDILGAGQGYDFGASYIDEQAGMLSILQNVRGIHHSIKWAFSELFLIGDERYLTKFATIFSGILNSEFCNDEQLKSFYFGRIQKILLSDLDEDILPKFLVELDKNLTSDDSEVLTQLVSKCKVKVKTKKESDIVKGERKRTERRDNDEDSLYMPGVFGKISAISSHKDCVRRAKKAIEIENFEDAKKELYKSLKILQENGWDIWSNNLGANDETFKLLVDISSKEEVVQLVSSLVDEEYYSADWRILNKILKILTNHFDKSEAVEIFETVCKHVQIIISPPDSVVDDYDWIDQKSDSYPSNDDLLFDFYLSFVDHPKPVFNSRSSEILLVFTRQYPDRFIERLAKESLSTEDYNKAEVCIGILHSIAIEDVELFVEYVRVETLIDNILLIESLSVKYAWLEIVRIINSRFSSLSSEEESVCNSMKAISLPEKINTVSDFDIATLFNHEISYVIQRLTEIGLWTDSEHNYLCSYLSSCYNDKLENVSKADRYLSNSYRQHSPGKQLRREIMSCISCIIAPKVTSGNVDDAIKYIRSYNPMFPDSNIRKYRNDRLQSALQYLFLHPKDFQYSMFAENGFEYLNHFEIFFSEKEGENVFVDLYLSLVKSGKKVTPKHFSNNQNPRCLLDNPTNDDSYTLFYSSGLSGARYGGRFTPSVVNPNFIGFSTALNESEFTNENWIEGRSWEYNRLGMPLREGSRLLLTSKRMNEMQSNGWQLYWQINYNDKTKMSIHRGTSQVTVWS